MASYAAALGLGLPKSMEPSTAMANTHDKLDAVLADELELLDEVREVADTADALERVAAAVQAEAAATDGWKGTETRTPFVGRVSFIGLGFSVVNGHVYVPNRLTAELLEAEEAVATSVAMGSKVTGVAVATEGTRMPFRAVSVSSVDSSVEALAEAAAARRKDSSRVKSVERDADIAVPFEGEVVVVGGWKFF